MKNFYRIMSGINITPLMVALSANDELWNQHPFRTSQEKSPFREINDIILRMDDIDAFKKSKENNTFYDNRESINYPAWGELPEARGLVLALMSTVNGIRLGRCFISKMAPGSKIHPHTDVGDDPERYYDTERYYNRFHIVLQGLKGSQFRAGDETVCMQTGEVWWFNNAVEHEVVNNSADDRVHLVVDIKVD